MRYVEWRFAKARSQLSAFPTTSLLPMLICTSHLCQKFSSFKTIRERIRRTSVNYRFFFETLAQSRYVKLYIFLQENVQFELPYVKGTFANKDFEKEK